MMPRMRSGDLSREQVQKVFSVVSRFEWYLVGLQQRMAALEFPLGEDALFAKTMAARCVVSSLSLELLDLERGAERRANMRRHQGGK